MILHVLFLLSSLLPLTQALDITGYIPSSSLNFESPALLPPSTLLVLSAPNVEYKTHPSPSGTFTFRNVTAGPSYLFRTECLSHTFTPLRVDTENGAIEIYQTFKANEWSHRGAKLPYPIQLVPSAK